MPENRSVEIAKVLENLARNKYVPIDDCQNPDNVAPVQESKGVAVLDIEYLEEVDGVEYVVTYQVTVQRKSVDEL
jgi:hypothetical protein